MGWLRKFRNTDDETERKIQASVEEERDMEPYPNTMDDMNELAVLHGYVTLFVVAFPAAPFLAFIACVVEAKVDGYKLCHEFQRPAPRRSQGLGLWTSIFKVFSLIAIVTNCWIYTW